LPAELPRRVHELVTQTCQGSNWTVRRTLEVLGITPSSYYRWLREEAWAKSSGAKPTAAVQVYEALPEEKRAVIDDALAHSEIRSDNGSGYLSGDFQGVLGPYGLVHHRITPPCPEENGIMERANRTTGQPDVSREARGVRPSRPARGPRPPWRDHHLVQSRSSSQRVGISSSDRLLSRGAEKAARGSSPQTFPSASPQKTKEPSNQTRNATI